MSKQTILTTSFLALSLCANAQFNMLFTSDSDLPNSLVNKVEEDKNGMIWVATEDGLCKYNGSRFITYRHNPTNPHSLSHNFIRTVCADSIGNVIVGTINGVQVYNIQTDDFTPRISAKEIGAKMGNVNSILRLADGEFFIGGTDAFTLQIDKNGKIVKNHDKSLSTFSFNLEKNYVKNLYFHTLSTSLFTNKFVTCGF